MHVIGAHLSRGAKHIRLGVAGVAVQAVVLRIEPRSVSTLRASIPDAIAAA